jgi:hypothetical protein
LNTLAISSVAFACIIGGMLVGIFLRHILPERHVSDDTKDVLKLGVGMIATLAALFLILDLDDPYGGMIKVSSFPLRNALALIGK